jgi:hypothetical protein
MLKSVKKGVYQTMNRQLNNFQRKLMLDQLDVSKGGDGNERPVLDALAAYKREKEAATRDAAPLTGVQIKIAQANAYKEFVTEMLGPQEPNQKNVDVSKLSYLRIQEIRRK